MIVDKNDLVLNEKELAKRMSGADISVAEEAVSQVREAMEPKYLMRKTEVLRVNQGIELGFGLIESENLKRNLKGCSHAYIVCATIGHGVDRLLRKVADLGAANQYLCDAAASAMVESLVDYIEDTIPEKTKPRFAPGYGDFSIEMQGSLLKYMRADNIGMGLTEKKLMIPQKSVTCIIGAIDEN